MIRLSFVSLHRRSDISKSEWKVGFDQKLLTRFCHALENRGQCISMDLDTIQMHLLTDSLQCI